MADIPFDAGLPSEMFQVVTGLPEDIGDEMITNAYSDIAPQPTSRGWM